MPFLYSYIFQNSIKINIQMSISPPILEGNSQNNSPLGFISIDDDHLYQVDILQDNSRIVITCKNTININNEKNIYSCKLNLEEIQRKFSCDNFTNFSEQMKRNMNMNLSKVQKKDNYLLLFFLVEGKNDYQHLKLFEEKEEVRNEIEIKTLKDAIDIINTLKKDIKFLKNEINNLNKKNKYFEDYINKMNLNFFYNSFDTKAYRLESIFNNLKSKEIMKTRGEFHLINDGIKHLFNKNINSLECIFLANENDFEKSIQTLQSLYNYSQNLIILILTKDDRRFGKFGFCSIIIGSPMNNFAEGFSQNNFNFNQNYDVNKDFVFSLNESQIYYYNDESNIKPFFTLSYDVNRQSLYGNEDTINSQNLNQANQNTTSGININFQTQQINNNQIATNQASKNNNRFMTHNNFNNNLFINLNLKEFKLSGKKEFNIKKLEVYKINMIKQ